MVVRLKKFVPLYTLDAFQRLFRMKRTTFEVIFVQLGTIDYFKTTTSGRKAIPLDKQLLIFLWHVGGLEPFCRIADRFNVSEFTILHIHKRICDAIKQYFVSKYILWPKKSRCGCSCSIVQRKKRFS